MIPWLCLATMFTLLMMCVQCALCVIHVLLHCAVLCYAQDLVAEVPAAKELFDKAADILGYDLLKVGVGVWAVVVCLGPRGGGDQMLQLHRCRTGCSGSKYHCRPS